MTTTTATGLTGFDRQKCQQRNRVAARKGFNAAPVSILPGLQGPAGSSLSMSVSPQALVTAAGSLPRTDEEALERINALRGDSDPLTLEQVYIHRMEAASDRFVSDRFMFLDRSTLRNIATDGAYGFAFMNSHRTGGLSHPSELPMGRTFAGQYQVFRESGESGQDSPAPTRARVVLGFYMLRGQYPNGSAAPSTDAMSAGIAGGTIFDCSIGLYGGEAICDVCGHGFEERDKKGNWLCDHMPGTTYEMSEDEQESQRARGVPGGEATYTLVGARPGEVSAVFDGAVPGAGFNQALRLARERRLPPQVIRQARRSYAGLAHRRDFQGSEEMQMDEDEVREQVESVVERALKRFGFRPQAGNQPAPAPVLQEQSFAPLQAETLLQEQSFAPLQAETLRQESETERELAAARKQLAELQAKTIRAEAEQFCNSQTADSRLMPYEREPAIDLYVKLARDDQDRPLDAGPSRTEAFRTLLSTLGQHSLAEKRIQEQVQGMSVLGPPTPAGTDAEFEKVIANIEARPNGQNGRSR